MELHDYLTILLFCGAIAGGTFGVAHLLTTGRAWRYQRMTRRNDAKLRGVVASRIGVRKVQLPERADARTASPQAD